MDTVLLAGRLVLAAVFLVAGITKLTDLNGSRRAMRGFGVPEGLTALLGTALPIVELVHAVALVPLATAWWGALGSLVLLLIFAGAIGYHMMRGRAPDCHCFGQLHSAPVGWSTLLRNGALSVVAGLIVVVGFDREGIRTLAWIDDRSPGEQVGLALVAVVVVALAVLGWLLIRTLKQNGQLLVRLDALESALDSGTVSVSAAKPEAGLPIGSPAPAFRLPSLDGGSTSLDGLRAAAQPVLLLFTDPNCKPCNKLMPDIGRWQRQYGGALTIAIVSRGELQANRIKSAQHGIEHVLIQQDFEVADTYKVSSTPTGVLVDVNGRIGPTVIEPDAIRDLVVRAVQHAQPMQITDPVPHGLATNDHGANKPGRPTIPLAPVMPTAARIGDPAHR